MSGLRVRGCAVLYALSFLLSYFPSLTEAKRDTPTVRREPGRKRRIRSRTRSVSLQATGIPSFDATRVGLQDAMRRLDASRCNPVARKGEIEQAPPRNEGARETSQELVN